jgi:hypothetical protein
MDLHKDSIIRKWASAILILATTASARSSDGAEVVFDFPSAIEFRDVTTSEFEQMHPEAMLLQGKLSISARFAAGNPTEIVDFVYVIKTDAGMRVVDYSPQTTMESAVTSDQIEVTAANENSTLTGLEAGGVVAPLKLTAGHNQASKKSESTHFKQVAAKDIILAAGTIDREHGVFFRIRPSRTTSLEGGKEFVLTVAVPRSWRGSVCAIECSARGAKQTTFSTSVVSAGAAVVQVGVYLATDRDAASLAEELCVRQGHLAELLAVQASKKDLLHTISLHKADAQQRAEIEEAEETVRVLRLKLQQMGASLDRTALN